MPHGPASPDPERDDESARRPGDPGEPSQDDPGPGDPGLPDAAPEGWRELPPSREDWLTEDQWVAWLSLIEPEEWAAPDEDPAEDPGDSPQPGTTERRPHGTAKPCAASLRGSSARPSGAALLGLAEYAAGDDDRFPGTTDDELPDLPPSLHPGRLRT